MKLSQILEATTEAIRAGERVVLLNDCPYPLQERPGGSFLLNLRTGSSLPTLSIESCNPHERTLVGQATKNFGHVILRIRRDGTLALDGSIDGRYVTDVEYECTRMMLEATPA